MTDPEERPQAIPVAATVVIVREGTAGPEVLMIRRPERGSFAGAWVFPGGKLEPGDAGADEAARARAAGVRETAEETGLTLLPAELIPLSRWTPPERITWRIRTWFFLAPDPRGTLTLAAEEAVAAEWMRPGDVLERHGRGELTLYPPTWVTLLSLSAPVDADGLQATARTAGIQEFETRAHPEPVGPVLMWAGDADYAGAADPAAGRGRHRLDTSALPWVYERTG